MSRASTMILAYFAANTDEEATYQDMSTKWDLSIQTVRDTVRNYVDAGWLSRRKIANRSHPGHPRVVVCAGPKLLKHLGVSK